MATLCKGRNLDGSRCRRKRRFPPCHSHTTKALTARALQQRLRLRRSLGTAAGRRGWVRVPPDRRGTPPLWTAVPKTDVRTVHEVWAGEGRAAIARGMGRVLDRQGWEFLVSDGDSADCVVFDVLAELCDAVRPEAAEPVLKDMATGLSVRVRVGRRALAVFAQLARHRRDLLTSLFAPAGLLPADQLRVLSVGLRLLGVQICAMRGRLDVCPCLESLVRQEGADRVPQLLRHAADDWPPLPGNR
ncbi:hypothetical protein [Marinactinospora rubrisoli]|uniref:Uncharacterized protein n=1 Tax=Marinactinospora rubrisoli TaxID=2715399 RepID=A0ABW2KHU2_9ACTN